MSSQINKHIHYCNSDWNNIVTDFNLNREIEIVLYNKITSSSPTDFSSSTKKNHTSAWIPRSLALIGLIALVGNIPIQSHLMASTDTNPLSFKINSTVDESSTGTPLQLTPIEIDNQYSETVNTIFGSHELALPKRAIETYIGHVYKDNSSKWTTYHVKSYDNLTNIFHKLGHQNSLKTLQKNIVLKKELASLKKGSIVRASSNEGKLSKLVFTNDNKNSYVITLNNGKYTGTWKKNIFEVRQSRASFTIKNGLFFDGRKAGIANNIIKQVVKVFDWDIDFSHDVRIGDEITVVFEEIYHDGDKVGNRHLLAAEFINKGREFKAIRYTYKDGKSDYFTPQGREMKKAFIRTPIAHARISSQFNPGRYHPVLHRIKKHEGTDFAARTGTPIMATGNGTVKFIGRKGGYGRMIILTHRESYSTRYGHMSRFKSHLKAGDKVYQGDIIGYVGHSGLATGPHLHYEFRLNNKAIDPMKASLPNSMSLTAKELQDFRNSAINLVLQLNVLHRFVKANIEINSAIGG